MDSGATKAEHGAGRPDESDAVQRGCMGWGLLEMGWGAELAEKGAVRDELPAARLAGLAGPFSSKYSRKYAQC